MKQQPRRHRLLDVLLLGSLALLLWTPQAAQAQQSLELVFIYDISLSTAGNKINWQNGIVDFLDNFNDEVNAGEVALVTFSDFPLPPFGEPGDRAYRRVADLDRAPYTDTKLALENATQEFGGVPQTDLIDFREAQCVAIHQALVGDGVDIDGFPGFNEAAGDIAPAGVSLSGQGVRKLIIMFSAPPNTHDPVLGNPDWPVAAANPDHLRICMGGSRAGDRCPLGTECRGGGACRLGVPTCQDAADALVSFRAPYFLLVEEPLPESATASNATEGFPISDLKALTVVSGGDVIVVGTSIELLQQAAQQILTVLGPIPIPTISEWGLVLLVLALMLGGTLVILRRNRSTA